MQNSGTDVQPAVDIMSANEPLRHQDLSIAPTRSHGSLRIMTGSTLRRPTSFAGSVTTLASGQLLAMVVPILAAPVLGRLYLPSEYGVFALYVACSSILAVFATLQLQHAIIAVRTERLAVQLVQLCLASSIAIAGFGAVAAFFLPFFSEYAGRFSVLRSWVQYLPLSVLLLGFIASVAPLANRRARYKEIAGIQVIIALTTVGVAIVGGIAGWGASGLLAGQLAGQAFGAAAYLILFRRLSKGAAQVGWKHLRRLFLRYRKFPIFTLPSELLGIINQQLPVFALNLLGATGLAGAFSRAFQLVAAPITLVGAAVGQVFRQAASEDYRSTGDCSPLFRCTGLALFALGLPFCVACVLFAPSIFTLYLGPNWQQAGIVAQVLAPMLLLRFVASPLSTVFLLAEAQHHDAKVMVGAFCLCATIVGACALAFDDPMAVIMGYSLSYSLVYVVQLAWSYRLSRGKLK